jgi:NADPH:quinone reductase-like Zn-dependent oxidoreductase
MRWPDVRAVEVAHFGGPDVLEERERPDPVPGPGQVVVKSSACDVLFVDTLIRSGRGADYFPIRPPYVPGNGVGGAVAAVGAEVDATKRDVVLGAGAEAAIDYGEAGWTDAVLDATAGRHPTVVLDGVGGSIGGQASELISDGGRFSAHGTPSGSFALIDPGEAERRGVTVTTIADLQYGDGDRSRLLTAVLAEVGGGRVAALIGQTFSLAEASKAHLAIESRETLAKTLLLTEAD